MPLRDHFHSPVNDKHHWSALYGGWPAEIVRTLFDLLPEGFRSGPRVQLIGEGVDALIGGESPTFTTEVDLADQDEYEVRVYDDLARRVAAIEIVSPSNKNRAETRAQFVAKCAALLREGVCVSIVDLVTERHENLYAELLALLGNSDPKLGEPPPMLYACTLRTRKPRKSKQLLDAWFYPMTIGQPLPTILIWLNEKLTILLPLEPSYQETCRLLRIA